jgi:hypothetical protein
MMAVDDRLGVPGLAEAGYERPVDLERVQGELPELGERRVAGAEVVDRQADAESAQGGEHLGRRGLVAPPQKRFHSNHVSAPQVHDRLIGNPQFPFCSASRRSCSSASRRCMRIRNSTSKNS